MTVGTTMSGPPLIVPDPEPSQDPPAIVPDHDPSVEPSPIIPEPAPDPDQPVLPDPRA